MIIQHKLENPKFCDGCPCFDGMFHCGYFKINNKNIDNKSRTKRPYKCLAKNSV